MKKITIKNILARKNKKPITCLTAYSKVTAKILDKYCDIILVGDSVGMSMYGMKTTKEVKIDTIILHGRSVKKIVKRSLYDGDERSIKKGRKKRDQARPGQIRT